MKVSLIDIYTNMIMQYGNAGMYLYASGEEIYSVV